ncbi:hypothetical protein NPIL_577641 [Nephila pilipes]|uniref:Uncharacterized protein n=1 Tax=Nephila pilipes TaxID=299642 RepID=A0A8X6QXU1_NEPPI|nr:hypothetical protein NPIL_577641 [Nephila pilipes]
MKRRKYIETTNPVHDVSLIWEQIITPLKLGIPFCSNPHVLPPDREHAKHGPALHFRKFLFSPPSRVAPHASGRPHRKQAPESREDLIKGPLP